MGLGKEAGPALVGAGEGTPGVSEELGLGELLGTAAQLNRTSGPAALRLCAWRREVISSFPVGFSPDQHGDVPGTDRLHLLDQLAHRRRLRDDRAAQQLLHREASVLQPEGWASSARSTTSGRLSRSIGLVTYW